MQIVFAAILSMGLLLVINFSGRIARSQQTEAERQRLQATITVLEQQQIDLLKDRDYAASDASVEHWAHTEGKMVRDGEILVIPIPAGIVEPTPLPPAPVLITTPTPEPEAPTGICGGICFLTANHRFRYVQGQDRSCTHLAARLSVPAGWPAYPGADQGLPSALWPARPFFALVAAVSARWRGKSARRCFSSTAVCYRDPGCSGVFASRAASRRFAAGRRQTRRPDPAPG